MSSHDDVVGGTWKFNRASGEKRRMARRRKQREEARRKQRQIEKAHERLLAEMLSKEAEEKRSRRTGEI